MSIISLTTRKPASIQGVRLFRAFRQGVGLQETTGKNRHLPVVTFYSPPPPSEPASHRRFRHQPRSHSPTHLHTTALPNLSDFFRPVSRKTRTTSRTVLYKLPNSTPHHSSHSTKNPPIPNFVHSAQLFHFKHIQNYYVASP